LRAQRELPGAEPVSALAESESERPTFTLASLRLADMVRCTDAIRGAASGARSLDEAASRIVRLLYDMFVQDDAERCGGLVRCFKTYPYRQLDDDLRGVVRGVLGSEPASGEMQTLALVATAGDEPAWNDRRRSQSHRCLPLPSVEFVRRSPMIAQLVAQLGLDVSAVVRRDTASLAKVEQSSLKVFHVEDALGSEHIPAQREFVEPYGIRSVLGFGGLFPTGDLFVVVLFSKVDLPSQVAELFAPIAVSAKLALLPFCYESKFGVASPARRDLTDVTRLRSNVAALEELLAVYERTVVKQAEDLDESMLRLGESELRFRRHFDHAGVGQVMADLEGRLLDVNRAFCAMVGMTKEEVLGTALVELCHPEDHDGLRSALASVVAGGADAEEGEHRYLRRDGKVVHALESISVVRDRADQPVGLTIVVQDVTARRQAEAALRATTERLSRTIATANDAFVAMDIEGRIVEWNQQAEATFGWSGAEVVGRPLAETIFPAHRREVRAETLDRIDFPVEEPLAYQRIELSALHRSGHEFPVEMTVWPLCVDGETSFNAFIRDITERRRGEEELRQAAFFDALTGLTNRALLQDRLKLALARSARQSNDVAVLVLDIDRFKVINDSLGHSSGDELLVEVGRRLRSEVRPADTVARLGGDEFVVLCDAVTSNAEAVGVVNRVLDAMRQPVRLEKAEVVVELSVGMAVGNGASAAPEHLMADADTAMYAAKKAGGGRFAAFNEEMRRAATARLEIESGLRRALEHDELTVLYQPAIRLATGDVVSAEALVRWRWPSGELVSPAQFIPVAEETGLIGPIWRVVLQRACREVARWQTDQCGPPLVYVNLSGRQLANADLAGEVRSIIDETGADPGSVGVEITETTLMEDSEGSLRSLQALRGLGLRIAVDDFGTGYSSLSYLQRFPVDVLKIDRSFVSGMPADSGSNAIVSGIIRLAHGLGLQTVAEGVETSEQLAALHELGCDIAQGYFWARPLASEDFLEWYQSARTTPAPPADRGRVAEESVLPTVVIADDLEAYRLLLRTVLEGEANVVAEAGDARTAVELARTHQPSLVLLDLSMPGGSGFDAIPRILEAAPSTRVVVISGLDATASAGAALALGASRYIEKGGSPADVLEVCRSLRGLVNGPAEGRP
jgi:diguanylate cyclase (GGDEF)-like protein/PAS domain S-box-containing protein